MAPSGISTSLAVTSTLPLVVTLASTPRVATLLDSPPWTGGGCAGSPLPQETHANANAANAACRTVLGARRRIGIVASVRRQVRSAIFLLPSSIFHPLSVIPPPGSRRTSSAAPTPTRGRGPARDAPTWPRRA